MSKPVQQQFNFEAHSRPSFRIINESDGAIERRTEKQTACLTQSNKEWVNDIACALTDATGENYGAGRVLDDAAAFFRLFFNVRHKLVKYRDSVNALLETLP